VAQNVATKEERPLQHFWLKNFLGVDTTDSRLSPLDNACFYDLANCQPVGFSNLHSVADIGPLLHDFGSTTTTPTAAVYSDWNVNIQGTEHLLIATRDGNLWDFNVSTKAVTQIGSGVAALDNSLDIAQWDYTTALIIASNGYWYWQGTGNITPVSAYPGGANSGLPGGGSAIAVYNQMVWVANGRLLLYSKAGDFTQWSTASGGGYTGLIDPTLKSNVTALFAANGYLYLFGETSVDAISDVYYPVDPASGVQLTTPSFTKLNLSAIIGTDQPESIMVFERLVLFANRLGVYKLYGTTVASVSSFDPNNVYLSSIDGTWQYLDFNHTTTITVSTPPSGSREYTFLSKASGGQVRTNALLNAAFLVRRLGDPIFPDGPVLMMYQKDQAGVKWWSVDYSNVGELTHVCMALVDYTPALFGYIDNKLYQLLADTTSAPAAHIMTALWDLGDPLSDKQAIKAGIRMTVQGDPSKLGVNVNMDTVRDSFPIFLNPIGMITWLNSTAQVVLWSSTATAQLYWINVEPPFLLYWGKAPNAFSKYLGFTVTTQRGTIFELNSFLLDWKAGPRWIGA
jgi:hypothetical protein